MRLLCFRQSLLLSLVVSTAVYSTTGFCHTGYTSANRNNMNFFGYNQFEIIDCTLSADGRPRYHTLKQFFLPYCYDPAHRAGGCSLLTGILPVCASPHYPVFTRHILTEVGKDHTLKAIFVRCKDVCMYWSKPEKSAL